jgi:integrase/recombinase XerC/integrase/recombinase XerD
MGELMDWQSPTSLRTHDVRKYVDWLSDRVSPATVALGQLGLRKFFRFLLDEGEITNDPTVKVKRVKFRNKPQPAYTSEEVKQILRFCKSSTWNGIRNRAIVTVLFDTGVRVGELVSMGLPDWQTHTIIVNGKTGQRTVPLGEVAILEIQRYVRRWGISEGPLWKGERGQFNESGVYQMIRKLCMRAKVEFKGVHAFRRAAAAQMKRLGMNDSDILEVMGWKDIEMLRLYTSSVATELAQVAHVKYSPADFIAFGSKERNPFGVVRHGAPRRRRI